jgi:glucose/mannose transport system substrate-binding protein
MKKLLPFLLGAALLTFGPMHPASSDETGDKQLEVFSWWVDGREGAALDTLFKVYQMRHPGTEVVNGAITGNGTSTASSVLQTRLAGGNPPDSWQVHPGYELRERYAAAIYCEPVTELYQSEGWDKVMPKTLLDRLSKGGDIYTVLTGLHRGNILLYNKKLLEQNGINVGDAITWDEFFAAADKLKAAGIWPVAMGDSDLRTTVHLFENTLLAVLGPEGWQDLFGGKLAFDDLKVKQAARLYGKLLDYQNPDHAALDWIQAVQRLADGKAAFVSQGDWALAELVRMGLKAGRDFGWGCHPGTDHAFVVIADGFTLAKNAPHPDEAMAWLRSIGSKEAQLAFNVLKGSIPVRTDIEKAAFGPYHQWAMDAFARESLVFSCAHGEVAPSAFVQALSAEISLFIADRNVDRFTAALVQAANDSGMTGR